MGLKLGEPSVASCAHLPGTFLTYSIPLSMNFAFRFAFPSSCPPSPGLPLQYLLTSHPHNLLSLSPFFLFLPQRLVETTLVSH